MNNFRTLTAVSACFFAALGTSAPLITLYLQSLGAGYAHISLILTTYVAAALVGNAIWGHLSDRWGRRKPILIGGLLGLVVAYLWLARVADPNQAWTVRLIEGLCVAAFTTISLAIMGDTLESSPQKGRRMGIYRGIGSLAFSGGAIMGGRLADAYSLAFVFNVCAAFYLLGALISLAVKDVRLAPVVQSVPEAPQIALTQPKRQLPLFFLAGVLLWMAAHSASASMWPNFMASLGYSKTAIGSLWGLAAFVEMPAMFMAGILSDVLGRALLLAAGGFVIALVQIGYIALAAYLPALMGVQILRGFGFGSYTTTAMTFTAEYGEQRTRGGRSGLFYTTASAGQLIGMFLGGTIAQFAGFTVMYTTCCVLAFASGLCFLAMRHRGRRVMSAKEVTPRTSEALQRPHRP